MKKLLFGSFIFAMIVLTVSCKKTSSTGGGGTSAGACKPTLEATNLSGNDGIYVYRYKSDGTVSSITKRGPVGNLLDSTAVSYDHVSQYSPGNTAGTFNFTTAVFQGNVYTGQPTRSDVSITIGGVEQHNYWSYFYFYDTKGRIIKVGEQTNNVIGDYEYDLNITYDDNDNVASLTYVITTGPNTSYTIVAAGYDDKPNPYSGLKNYPFYMHRGWDNYDPESVFDALSKHNLLGYTFSGITRTIAYTYNSNGFPTLRRNTNTNASGSATIDETYAYECK